VEPGLANCIQLFIEDGTAIYKKVGVFKCAIRNMQYSQSQKLKETRQRVTEFLSQLPGLPFSLKLPLKMRSQL